MIAPQRSHPGVEETRARILSAAREIFERNGTRGTTTREVAERAGVNEATLFRHFGSKAALLVAMREQSCMLEEIREMVAGMHGEDIGADLRQIAQRGVANMFQYRDLMCVSLAEDAQSVDDLNPEWRGPSQIVELLSTYFAERVAEGRMRGEPGILARTFMGILFQYVVARKLWQSHAVDQATVDFLVDVFVNGVQR